MAKIKIKADPEGVMAVREFAATMPLAVSRIAEATDELKRVYDSVSDSVGVHEEDFRNLLMLIKSAQEKSTEAIEELPKKLYETAQRMETYISNRARIGQ